MLSNRKTSNKGFFGDILSAGASALGGLGSTVAPLVAGAVGSRYGGLPGMVLGQAAGGLASGTIQGVSSGLAGALKGLPFQKGGIITPLPPFGRPYKMGGIVTMKKVKKTKKAGKRKAKK